MRNNTLIPNDWTYTVKKALNYRIYSNPIMFTDMVDIIYQELLDKFGTDRIVYFNINDFEKTIKFRVSHTTTEYFNIIEELHENCLVRFCSIHKDAIKAAINEQSNKQYADLFEEMLMFDNKTLVSQLSMFFGHPVINVKEFCATFRLY